MSYQVHLHQAGLLSPKQLQSLKQRPSLVEFPLWLVDWEPFQVLQGPFLRAWRSLLPLSDLLPGVLGRIW